MSMGEVTVRHRGPVSVCPVISVELGAISGRIDLDVDYQTDRYWRVRLTWQNPRIQDADDGRVWLGNAVLDTMTGELLAPDFDTHSEEARRRPRTT